MSPITGILTVLGGLGLLLGGVHCLGYTTWCGAELRRKLVHVGMGLLTISFPWLFHERWPVWLLAIFATVALGGIRLNKALRQTVGRALHDVERSSWGDICFPWAVAVIFWLANGDAVTFGVPILLLTFGDAAGALTGVRYGKTGFSTPEGNTKSIEGSVAVFGVSFLCAHLPLLLMTSMGRAESVCASMTLALLVTLLESVAVRGLDNLLIPLGAFFLLQFYRNMEAAALLSLFGITTGMLGVMVLTRKWNGLDAGAILGGALLGYASFTLGGWLFLLPLFGFYGRHLFSVTLRPHLRSYRHGITAILSLTASAIPWIGGQFAEGSIRLLPFTLALCLHCAVNRDGGVIRGVLKPTIRSLLESCVVAILFCIGPVIPFLKTQQMAQVLVGSIVLVPCILLCCRRILPREDDGVYAINEERFFLQGLLALVGSGIFYLLIR